MKDEIKENKFTNAVKSETKVAQKEEKKRKKRMN